MRGGAELLDRLRARAVAAVREPKAPELALVAALLFALFVYLPLRLTFGATGANGGRPEPVRAPFVRTADVDPKGELEPFPTPPYAQPRGPDRGKHRNLFTYQAEPTPPPTPLPPTPPPRPTEAPRPTATPYASPFTLIGIARQGERGIAFLKAGDVPYVALEGSVVELKGTDGRVAKHRIKKVGIETVEIGPVEFEATVTLRLGSQP